MIRYWLGLIKVVWRWLIDPPKGEVKIDPSAPCPVCGWPSAGLNAMAVKQNSQLVLVAQHRCSVCGAKWFAPPLTQIQPGTVWPADGPWPDQLPGERRVRVIG